MNPNGYEASWTLELLASMGLVSTGEVEALRGVVADAALADCIEHAETIHLHVKVDDTGRLAPARFEAAGGVLDHGRDGFVKFRMPGGINAIFSHIAISADDLRECAAARRTRPFLDHIGIDLREVSAGSRAAFDAMPPLAAQRGWAHVGQGGAGRAVRCCHVEVAEKHWIFPAAACGRIAVPIEFAYGPLRQSDGPAGCDLRPANPRLVTVGAPASCCPA